MMFTTEYVEQFCECSEKQNLPAEVYDQVYDTWEEKKWKPNSEAYYCQVCTDTLTESSC